MMLSLLAGCGSSTSTTAVSEPAAEPAEAASETAAAGTTAETEKASTESADITGELNIIHYLTETAKLAALDGRGLQRGISQHNSKCRSYGNG